MILLAIDTSTTRAALALGRPDPGLEPRVAPPDADPARRHGRGLIPALADLLALEGLKVAESEGLLLDAAEARRVISLCFLFATGFAGPGLLEFSRSGHDRPPRWWTVGGFRRNRQAVPAKRGHSALFRGKKGGL